jgi:hypothetical protein
MGMSKLIKLHSKTKQRLDDIKRKDDTYDSIINELLDVLYPIKDDGWNSTIIIK